METTIEEISTYRVVVTPCEANVGGYMQAAHQLGITQLTGIHVNRLYFLQGQLDKAGAAEIAYELLADPVTERVTVDRWRGGSGRRHWQLPVLEDSPSPIHQLQSTVEVTLLPGVTDPPADSLIRAAHLLGKDGLIRAATGQQFLLDGSLDGAALEATTNCGPSTTSGGWRLTWKS